MTRMPSVHCHRLVVPVRQGDSNGFATPGLWRGREGVEQHAGESGGESGEVSGGSRRTDWLGAHMRW